VTLPREELHRYLHTIAQKGREAINVIDQLLLARAQPPAEIEEAIGALDMASVVAEVLERLAYAVEEYQAEIVLPDSWPVALGHTPWVEEVWTNFIGNAIKYGGQPPRVELGAMEQEDGTVRFWARDNGPGLATEEQVQLFTPFTRLDQIRDPEYGLGLVLAQRVVEKLGGQVGVESEVGQGSLFFFTLPSAS
jgi:signal transduction histidine kinase